MISFVGRRQPNRWRQQLTAVARSSPATGNVQANEGTDDKEEVAIALVDQAGGASANGTGYALFTRSLLPGVVAYTFDLGSGVVTARHPLIGPFGEYLDGYYGESTRILPWDAAAAKFYFADVGAGDGAQSGGAASTIKTLTVYTIDPATGKSTAAAVHGCGASSTTSSSTSSSAYPVGMAWDASLGMLLVATQTEREVTFCAIDPQSGSGTPKGTVTRGTTEASSASYYAAYISHAHAGLAWRVGHLQVTTGRQSGVGYTNLSSLATAAGAKPAAAPASWHHLSFGSHAMPATLSTHPRGGFISLAQRAAPAPYAEPTKPHAPNAAGAIDTGRVGAGSVSARAVLDVVQWGMEGDVRVVANLTNAHTPVIPSSSAQLGYVADSVHLMLYGAMTIAAHPSPLLPGVADKWSVSTVDLDSGKLVQAPLKPQPSLEGAETTALCGFGIVAPPSQRN